MRLIFKTSSGTPDFFYVFSIILSFSTCSQSFKKICTWEILGANVLKYLYAADILKFTASLWWPMHANAGYNLTDSKILSAENGTWN